MRRGTIRAIAAAAAAATVLTACGGGSEVAADPEPTAPAATEPTPEPAEETPEAVEAPVLDLTIEDEADVERVVAEILAFRAWLFGHPDERSLVDRIYWSECDCHAGLSNQLAELDEEGRRIVGKAPFDVVAVEVTSSTENSRSVTVTFRPPPATVYGPDGSVVNEAETYFPEVTEKWLLARNESGRYRALRAASA